MTDIGGDELANKRIEQAAGHAQEILTAPSEQLAPPSRRLVDSAMRRVGRPCSP